MIFRRTLTESSTGSTTSTRNQLSLIDSAYSSVENLSISPQPKTESIADSSQFVIRPFTVEERDEILRQSLAAGKVRKEERKEAKKLKKLRLKERLEILDEEQRFEVR